MTEVVIAIGSNQQREHNICAALDQLHQSFGELNISPVYESLAQSSHQDTSQDKLPSPYLNLVVSFQTEHPLSDLKNHLNLIEDHQGRLRHSRDVSLDLDILLYGNWTGDFDGGSIPHPDIQYCAYVLRPLADLLPNRTHPFSGQSFKNLWQHFHSEHQLTPVEFVWHDQLISSAACLPLV